MIPHGDTVDCWWSRSEQIHDTNAKQLVTLSSNRHQISPPGGTADSGTDLDNTYQVTVRATDFEGNNSDQSLNGNCYRCSGSTHYLVNSRYLLKSTNECGDIVERWSVPTLSGGTDVADFAINSTTGALTFMRLPQEVS